MNNSFPPNKTSIKPKMGWWSKKIEAEMPVEDWIKFFSGLLKRDSRIRKFCFFWIILLIIGGFALATIVIQFVNSSRYDSDRYDPSTVLAFIAFYIVSMFVIFFIRLFLISSLKTHRIISLLDQIRDKVNKDKNLIKLSVYAGKKSRSKPIKSEDKNSLNGNRYSTTYNDDWLNGGFVLIDQNIIGFSVIKYSTVTQIVVDHGYKSEESPSGHVRLVKDVTQTSEKSSYTYVNIKLTSPKSNYALTSNAIKELKKRKLKLEESPDYFSIFLGKSFDNEFEANHLKNTVSSAYQYLTYAN